MQATNFSAEHNFTTAPVDGQGPVQFLAIADLGYCETDSSLEWESDYPNPITYTPPGTLAALKVEVSLTESHLFTQDASRQSDGPLAQNWSMRHAVLRSTARVGVLKDCCLASDQVA